MKMRRSRKSFTLVEALLAIVIIAIILVVSFVSFATSFNYLRHVKELRQATLILQEEMSKVRDLPFSNINLLGSTFTSSLMSSLKDASGTVKKSYYGGSDKTIKISFQVKWTSFDEKQMDKTITTLMTDHGINKQ